MEKSEFLDVRNKSEDDAAKTLNPEDTRAEALEKREDAVRARQEQFYRAYDDLGAVFDTAKEDTKGRAELLEQIRGSANENPMYRDGLNAVTPNTGLVLSGKMGIEDLYKEEHQNRALMQAEYEDALRAERPELAAHNERKAEEQRRILEKEERKAAESGQPLVYLNTTTPQKQAEPTLETYEAAAKDVSDFMATKSEDAAARADIAAKMQERGDDAGYVTALKRITPDLHTLTEEHTPALREEHYRAEQEAQKTRETEQSSPALSGEVRMTEAQMKAENAAIVREAEKNGTIPGTLDLDNPEDRDFAAKMASAARDEAANNKANTAQALDNLMDAQESKKSLAKDDYIVPRSVSNKYEQVAGKFFSKDEKSPRLMFEDKGKALATSSTDKAAISDMVTLAKAKQWDSLALSGSQEFRREAWLQAESQGIKTKGYTPKEQDLAQLQALTQQRQVNTIQPIAERGKAQEAETRTAPRHDINKNQAALADGAMKLRSSNMQELSTMKQFQGLSAQDLGKVAFWRGIVQEETKTQPKTERDERLAHFDKEMQDPNKVKQLPDPALKETGKAQIKERTQERNSHEQELGR